MILFVLFPVKYNLTLLSEENISNDDGSDCSCQICKQSAGHCMARVLDADTAKIDGKDVEGGVCWALEDTT